MVWQESAYLPSDNFLLVLLQSHFASWQLLVVWQVFSGRRECELVVQSSQRALQVKCEGLAKGRCCVVLLKEKASDAGQGEESEASAMQLEDDFQQLERLHRLSFGKQQLAINNNHAPVCKSRHVNAKRLRLQIY